MWAREPPTSRAVCCAAQVRASSNSRSRRPTSGPKSSSSHGCGRRPCLASNCAWRRAITSSPDDSSFDVVHSSMVLHHLEPAAAVGLLAEMRRVARRAVIVNDLDRGRHWWLLARLLVALTTRNAYTRHDAPLSVRRAYRAAEVREMAARAGLVERASHRTFPRIPLRAGLRTWRVRLRFDVAVVGGGPAGAADGNAAGSRRPRDAARRALARSATGVPAGSSRRR